MVIVNQHCGSVECDIVTYFSCQRNSMPDKQMSSDPGVPNSECVSMVWRTIFISRASDAAQAQP